MASPSRASMQGAVPEHSDRAARQGARHAAGSSGPLTPARASATPAAPRNPRSALNGSHPAQERGAAVREGAVPPSNAAMRRRRNRAPLHPFAVSPFRAEVQSLAPPVHATSGRGAGREDRARSTPRTARTRRGFATASLRAAARVYGKPVSSKRRGSMQGRDSGADRGGSGLHRPTPALPMRLVLDEFSRLVRATAPPASETDTMDHAQSDSGPMQAGNAAEGAQRAPAPPSTAPDPGRSRTPPRAAPDPGRSRTPPRAAPDPERSQTPPPSPPGPRLPAIDLPSSRGPVLERALLLMAWGDTLARLPAHAEEGWIPSRTLAQRLVSSPQCAGLASQDAFELFMLLDYLDTGALVQSGAQLLAAAIMVGEPLPDQRADTAAAALAALPRSLAGLFLIACGPLLGMAALLSDRLRSGAGVLLMGPDLGGDRAGTRGVGESHLIMDKDGGPLKGAGDDDAAAATAAAYYGAAFEGGGDEFGAEGINETGSYEEDFDEEEEKEEDKEEDGESGSQRRSESPNSVSQSAVPESAADAFELAYVREMSLLDRVVGVEAAASAAARNCATLCCLAHAQRSREMETLAGFSKWDDDIRVFPDPFAHVQSAVFEQLDSCPDGELIPGEALLREQRAHASESPTPGVDAAPPGSAAVPRGIDHGSHPPPHAKRLSEALVSVAEGDAHGYALDEARWQQVVGDFAAWSGPWPKGWDPHESPYPLPTRPADGAVAACVRALTSRARLGGPPLRGEAAATVRVGDAVIRCIAQLRAMRAVGCGCGGPATILPPGLVAAAAAGSPFVVQASVAAVSGPALRHLSLRGCAALRPDALLRLLDRCPSLQSLDLGGVATALSAAAAVRVATLAYLQSLDLTACHGPEPAQREEAATVSVAGSSLRSRTRTISGARARNRADAEAAAAAAAAAAGDSDDATPCAINRFLLVLASTLACRSGDDTPALIALNLSALSGVGDAAVRAVGDATDRRLEDVCLFGCYRLSDEALLGLASPALRRINTNGCYKIDDGGRRFLLGANPSVLFYNKPRDFGALSPAAAAAAAAAVRAASCTPPDNS